MRNCFVSNILVYGTCNYSVFRFHSINKPIWYFIPLFHKTYLDNRFFPSMQQKRWDDLHCTDFCIDIFCILSIDETMIFSAIFVIISYFSFLIFSHIKNAQVRRLFVQKYKLILPIFYSRWKFCFMYRKRFRSKYYKILLGKKLFLLNVLTQIYPSQMVMAAAQLNTIIISGVFSLKMFECKVGNTRKKVLRFHPLAKK